MSHEPPDSSLESGKADPRVSITEKDIKVENHNAGFNDSHVNEGPQHISRAIPPKDNMFQALGGSQKWGTRGPSFQQDSSTFKSSQTKPLMPSLSAVIDSPTSPAQNTEVPQASYPSSSSVPRFREFELNITPSNTNHQAYIERQGYYGPFTPNKKTLMAEDLEGRVPLEGLIDCQVAKPEVPLRIRSRRVEKGTLKPFSLKALYEEKLASDKTI